MNINMFTWKSSHENLTDDDGYIKLTGVNSSDDLGIAMVQQQVFHKEGKNSHVGYST